VTNHLELSSASHQWNVDFLRAALYWEVDHFTLFFNLLHSLRLRRGSEDKLCCVPSNRGWFNIKSYYSVLVPHDNIHFS
jgi:hypothetical protein